MCNYCIGAVSQEVELLYMPKKTFREIVYPSQDLSFSTEKCRSILKLAPGQRKKSDLNYLISHVLSPHAFFQQIPYSARTRIARGLTLGFIEEGEVSGEA
jgi:hypothetical protein